jgi:magnesium transporter
MITVYYRVGDIVANTILTQVVKTPDHVVWVDVLSPGVDELNLIEARFGLQMPSRTDHWKNQILNRLYIEGDYAYMTAALITKIESPYPGTAPVTFILGPQFLLTMHEIDPTSFKNFAVRFQKSCTQFPSAIYVLKGLLEEVITRVAYNSEIVVDTLDGLSHDIFGLAVIEEGTVRKNISAVKISKSSSILQAVLKRLGATADLNSKINESLHSLNRLLVFFRQEISEDPRVDAKIDILLTDTHTLITQTSFLSDKVTFQLDATLGMINVEQNLIIKIFSMVAVFFLPPTLISSMYGMNFKFMPELEWSAGYPIALFMMFLSAAIPYYYFWRRGWL